MNSAHPVEISEDLAPIVKKWKGKRGTLIMALHELQNRHGFVPRDKALALAAALEVPLARIYEVITFYHYFKLEAPGRKIVSVCMGTACYLKGAPRIVEVMSEALGIQPGETTADGEYHLQGVRCVGCCGLAPVVTVNEQVFAKVKPDEAAHTCICAKES